MEKTFYLSFDGSPNPPASEGLLKKLEECNLPATFFMEGFRLEKDADCARCIQAASYDIGNHSYTHPEFDTISLEDCIWEVDMTQAIIHKELGFYPVIIQPPMGILTSEVEKTLLDMGFDIVLWSNSVRDWEGNDAASVAKRILSQAQPGEIIALHNRTEWLMEFLDLIIPALIRDGYVFKKISQTKKHGTIKYG